MKSKPKPAPTAKKRGRPLMNEGRVKLTTRISPATDYLLTVLRQKEGKAIGRIIDEAISMYGKKP